VNIKVIIEAGEDGYFVAHVPALKSCWSQGKTREEALQNIREAIDLYLQPEPEDIKDREVVDLAV
jgi:predicted RNase H-like HicB family nuclease